MAGPNLETIAAVVMLTLFGLVIVGTCCAGIHFVSTERLRVTPAENQT